MGLILSGINIFVKEDRMFNIIAKGENGKKNSAQFYFCKFSILWISKARREYEYKYIKKYILYFVFIKTTFV